MLVKLKPRILLEILLRHLISARILLGTQKLFGASGLTYFRKYGRKPKPNP